MKSAFKWIWLCGLLTAFYSGGCFGPVSVGFGVIPSQDFYGKVIGEDGQPVSDAQIIGTLVKLAPGIQFQYGMMGTSDGFSGGGGGNGTIKVKLQTKSDSSGLF